MDGYQLINGTYSIENLDELLNSIFKQAPPAVSTVSQSEVVEVQLKRGKSYKRTVYHQIPYQEWVAKYLKYNGATTFKKFETGFIFFNDTPRNAIIWLFKSLGKTEHTW